MALIFTLITCGIMVSTGHIAVARRLIRQRLTEERLFKRAVLYFDLYIFGGVIAYALIQHELNKLIEQDEA